MKRAVSLTALAGIVSMILGLGLAWLLLSPSYTEVISIRSDAGLVAIHEIGNVSATVSTPHRIVVKRPGDGASNSNVVMVADHVDTIKLMWASRNSLLICMDSGEVVQFAGEFQFGTKLPIFGNVVLSNSISDCG